MKGTTTQDGGKVTVLDEHKAKRIHPQREPCDYCGKPENPNFFLKRKNIRTGEKEKICRTCVIKYVELALAQ